VHGRLAGERSTGKYTVSGCSAKEVPENSATATQAVYNINTNQGGTMIILLALALLSLLTLNVHPNPPSE
jgi:hypothetical protein